ncbi:hypothetical protein RFI_05684 [Reticulomyxa filosa]|uniref:Uncharacterized protein n=1 Tax=Reticulomyxa filosa TaxID=46433 RepID=X6NZQ6_RETFI|nr:hypothetical protein RFI_05684 [Reticulomyxa filosa]|eukprot:ETO31436.1 hypothetical protein RFI_05684 [Reticulomyxa filosa]
MHPSDYSTVSRRPGVYNRFTSKKTSFVDNSPQQISGIPRLHDDFISLSFSSGEANVKEIIDWVEKQRNLLNGAMTSAQFEVISKDINNAYHEIKQGMDCLPQLVAYSSSDNGAQDKAELQSLQQHGGRGIVSNTLGQSLKKKRTCGLIEQWDCDKWQKVKRSTDTALNHHRRRIRIENSKGKLLNNAMTGVASKTQCARVDESSNSIVSSALAAWTSLSSMFGFKTLRTRLHKKLDDDNCFGFANAYVGRYMKRTQDDWILFFCMLLIVVILLFLWFHFM